MKKSELTKIIGEEIQRLKEIKNLDDKIKSLPDKSIHPISPGVWQLGKYGEISYSDIKSKKKEIEISDSEGGNVVGVISLKVANDAINRAKGN